MWRVHVTAVEGPEGPAAVPVGGGGAWPDNESTRQAGAAGVEGARNTSGARQSLAETAVQRSCCRDPVCLQLFCQAILDGAVAQVAEHFEEDAAEENASDGGPHARGSVAPV